MYPTGIDAVWIACDKIGMLAAFITAGEGPIPQLTLLSELISLQDIEELILELPVISPVDLKISLPRPDDFIALSERGFFVYDWTDIHRIASEDVQKYELISKPHIGKQLNELPIHLSSYVQKIQFQNTIFQSSEFINISSEFESICL